jgi:uncharacterized protein YozE (UPF0346 family)
LENYKKINNASRFNVKWTKRNRKSNTNNERRKINKRIKNNEMPTPYITFGLVCDYLENPADFPNPVFI